MYRLLDSSWAPYCIPYFGFLLVVQFAAAQAWSLPLRVALPLGFLLYFARRRRYPELQWASRSPWGFALDAGVGVAGAVVWVVPFLLWPSLRPGPDVAFDPAQLGASWTALTLALRFTGYALVTPFMEELFLRSWLQRTVDSLGRHADFRSQPMARFALRSFAVVVLWFTLSHAHWEWPVAVLWILMTQAWFYRRKNLASLVVTHVASNVLVFLFVLLGDGRILDARGVPVPLWFFL